MQPEFWHDRWRAGQIGFHQSAVHRHLEQHWPALDVADSCSVLVPLCGKSLDMLWLRAQEHVVIWIELSSIALESFCMEHGIPARRRRIGDFDVYEAPRLKLFCGDFFAMTPELLGPVSAVYDRAALISWAPELRASYVDHLTSLIRCDAKTLLITMEYPQAQMTGPPFSLVAKDIDRLYIRHHAIHELAREDILTIEPKLRARGLTELHEACYLLTRL